MVKGGQAVFERQGWRDKQEPDHEELCGPNFIPRSSGGQ